MDLKNNATGREIGRKRTGQNSAGRRARDDLPQRPAKRHAVDHQEQQAYEEQSVTLFVRRAGALILVAEACYLLLMELALAVFVVDTSHIDHTDTGGYGGLGGVLLLAAEGLTVLLLLWAAAVLGLASFADKGPSWARAAGFGLVALTQVLGTWAATSNALTQDAGADVLVNAVMVLFALTAGVACLLGLRGAARKAPVAA
ncbi:hypothetical protein [Streptomyces lavendulocolor]|uniref:hypothetical protein n=1 Tax=Streptomyces lavendulocolor TaxID=67316 RepID=UPI003C2DC1DA